MRHKSVAIAYGHDVRDKTTLATCRFANRQTCLQLQLQANKQDAKQTLVDERDYSRSTLQCPVQTEKSTDASKECVPPVMKDAAWDARKSTTDATSSTRALRPIGCCTAVIASMVALVLCASLASLSAISTHTYGVWSVCSHHVAVTQPVLLLMKQLDIQVVLKMIL